VTGDLSLTLFYLDDVVWPFIAKNRKGYIFGSAPSYFMVTPAGRIVNRFSQVCIFFPSLWLVINRPIGAGYIHCGF